MGDRDNTTNTDNITGTESGSGVGVAVVSASGSGAVTVSEGAILSGQQSFRSPDHMLAHLRLSASDYRSLCLHTMLPENSHHTSSSRYNVFFQFLLYFIFYF